MRKNSGWERWPLGADEKGHPIQDLSLQLLMIGDILVEWMIIDSTDVYLRRIQD